MGLESPVTKISDLNPLWPLGSDQKLAGDDHIRNIKTVLQTITFLKSIRTFMSSGTWNRPAGVTKVLIYCLGGGAGGGGGIGGGYAGGGGGSGSAAIKWLDVSAIAQATITVGVGGAGGNAAGGLGSNGTATHFVVGATTHCLGTGGRAGTSANMDPGQPEDRAQNIGDIILMGYVGAFGVIVPTTPNIAWGGNGGGPGGGFSNSPAWVNSGGGGGGGQAIAGAGIAGGAGGSGYCVILEVGV